MTALDKLLPYLLPVLAVIVGALAPVLDLPEGTTELAWSFAFGSGAGSALQHRREARKAQEAK